MTIMGTLTRTANEDDWACFHAAHPETKDWVAHEFAIYTFERVDKVRWVGGFGDEHYVGWLDVVGYLGDAGENGTEETGMAKEQPDAMPQAVEVQV